MIENEIFYCEHLVQNEENTTLIKNFSAAKITGYGLEKYLKNCAFRDEENNSMRTYLVKDKISGELVGYFSLKAGMVSNAESGNILASSFDMVSGIELANFGVNGKYKKAHGETKGIGKIIFMDFILPICIATSDIIGAKILYIFALPYKDLINYYKTLNFSRLSKSEEVRVHRRIRPRYDNSCIFMYRSILEKSK